MGDRKSGFTLIELIVVITILAILGTISFISFKGYTGDARDSKVISDTTNLQKGLSLYRVQNGTLPMPDNSVKIKSDSNVITYEGEIGDNVKNLIKASDGMKTPSGGNYLYATNGTQKYFSVIGLFENDTANLVTTAYAEGKYKSFKGDEIITVFNSDNTFVNSEFVVESGDFSNNFVFLGENRLSSKEEVPATTKINKKYTGNWTDFDMNCNIPDIRVGNQVWAGCNSTLGFGLEWGQTENDIINNTNSYNGTVGNCLDYWNKGTSCTILDINMQSNANPKVFFDLVQPNGRNGYGDKEFNTIWGKFYSWDMAMGNGSYTGACAPGRHIPSESDFGSLETTLNGGTDCRNGADGSVCDGLGWMNHNTKNDTNNFANILKTPLSGRVNTDEFSFWGRGRNAYFWTNKLADGGAYYYRLNRALPGVQRRIFDLTNGYSVRCIKDN